MSSQPWYPGALEAHAGDEADAAPDPWGGAAAPEPAPFEGLPSGPIAPLSVPDDLPTLGEDPVTAAWIATRPAAERPLLASLPVTTGRQRAAGSVLRALAEPAPVDEHLAGIPDPRQEPGYEPGVVVAVGGELVTWPEPEDRGLAVLSVLGETEYVADLLRPGRIALWAAEEGSGKSYSVDGELGIRVAIAGGSFAGTWDVLRTGPVLYLSEMHADDDFTREATVLASLGLEREQLVGRYFRLPLMMAAGGKPALTVPEWRAWVVEWLRARRAVLLIFDTATGATQVDPWGSQIQGVYAGLRAMLEAYPALAIVLVVHLKKPQGHGERRLSDVLGEWGRWNDVTVVQENDGTSLARSRLTVRKRVRHERRIVATKAGGLLVDPVDLDETKGTKVPADDVLAAITASPGVTLAELGTILEVSRDTASNYVKALGEAVRTERTGPKGAVRVFPTSEPPNTSEYARFGGPSAVDGSEARATSEPPNEPYRGSEVVRSEQTASPPAAVQAALDVFGDDLVDSEPVA